MLKEGDKVIVNDSLELASEDDDKLIGKIGTVIKITNWIFPVEEVHFDDKSIQQLYDDLGKRCFSFYELDKI